MDLKLDTDIKENSFNRSLVLSSTYLQVHHYQVLKNSMIQ